MIDNIYENCFFFFYVLAPVTNLSVSGRNWLQHGDILNLQIKCSGSSPLEHCVKIFSGKLDSISS